jgi:5-methylcytosine-specific restriction protein A
MSQVAKQSGRKIDNSVFYNSRAWRKNSKAFLAENPLCVECKAGGRVELATVSDHVTPINQGGDPWGWNNLQPLCTRHHAIKSGKEAHQ